MIETSTIASATSSATITRTTANTTTTSTTSATPSAISTIEMTIKTTTTGIDATQSTIKPTTAESMDTATSTYVIPSTTSVKTASESITTKVEVALTDGCEAHGSDWICSNGRQNRSLCLKRCQNGEIDEAVCICEQQSCSWYHKGNQCSTNSMNTPDVAPAVESMNNFNMPGNSPFDNISSSESANDLVSLIQEINVSNIGYINVNLHLK